MTEQYEGIVNPPIDSLLEKVDSKYALVLFAAKRARQINAYYSQLHEGLFEYVGPLVDTKLNEKALSIALREIDENLLEIAPVSEDPAVAEQDEFAEFSLEAQDDSAAFSDEGFLPDAPVADATTDPGTATDDVPAAEQAEGGDLDGTPTEGDEDQQ